MTRYYFVRSDGHLYRLTRKAYHAWIKDSARQSKAQKISRYGLDLGEIASITSFNEYEIIDFERMS